MTDEELLVLDKCIHWLDEALIDIINVLIITMEIEQYSEKKISIFVLLWFLPNPYV